MLSNAVRCFAPQGAAGASAQAAAADQADWEAVKAGQWPFQRVADELCADLLESAWERRHGAAVGLRAILGSHAGAACVTAPSSLVPSGAAPSFRQVLHWLRQHE